MEIKRLDNLYTVVLVLVVASLLYFSYIYYTSKEKFEVPAPAASVKKPEPIPIPREVSPSGPNPPNARIPDVIAKQQDNYNIVPNDTQDENYGSQDIQDNLRYPERLFGPGMKNDDTRVLVESGAASRNLLPTAEPIQPFNAEPISSGGLMGRIGANDTNMNQNYASF
uniref:Uncharacterized protein n=1 Tax=viral metagenome TaxID=1070528 RepID=A0A6C0D6Z7_9ZZZZ